jgi:hypothetical protein
MRYLIPVGFLVCLCCGLCSPVNAQQRKTRTKPARTSPSQKMKNHPPAFPEQVEVKTATSLEYDSYGRVNGAVTIIIILTPAVDPDGDSLTYTWTGTVVEQGKQQTIDLKDFKEYLKSEGLTATWRRFIFWGEPASGIITVTASDGRGGTASHKICIGQYVRCSEQ